ncbi:MAG: hypothetical protein DMG96_08565 [Acidobacteria bacterium]|nr:MAG: hypothetical protein DMG98_19330 [Acidobacteriota bacterium]PYV78241.1 MAG: hypothetical protein DMG96_08565 [Acidobacteriota bacterium]
MSFFHDARNFFPHAGATFTWVVVLPDSSRGLTISAKHLCKRISPLQESPVANYMLGGIVHLSATAYSRLHMKGALNFPTYSRAGADTQLSAGACFSPLLNTN